MCLFTCTNDKMSLPSGFHLFSYLHVNFFERSQFNLVRKQWCHSLTVNYYNQNMKQSNMTTKFGIQLLKKGLRPLERCKELSRPVLQGNNHNC
jgi:hypothetical protein